MSLPSAVNVSIVGQDRPLESRIAAVAAAGFEGIELWWPFAGARPDDADVDALIATVKAAGLPLVAMNLFAGDLSNGDRGVLSWPDREGDVAVSAQVARRVSEELGTRVFNALYGRRREGLSQAYALGVATENLLHVGEVLDAVGATVVLEAVSGFHDYPLRTASDVRGVVDGLHTQGCTNVGMLLDVYHLSSNGDDVSATIDAHLEDIRHVQLADAPGRGAPGSGSLPLADWAELLEGCGYDGWLAWEYLMDDDDLATTLARTREAL